MIHITETRYIVDFSMPDKPTITAALETIKTNQGEIIAYTEGPTSVIDEFGNELEVPEIERISVPAMGYHEQIKIFKTETEAKKAISDYYNEMRLRAESKKVMVAKFRQLFPGKEGIRELANCLCSIYPDEVNELYSAISFNKVIHDTE